MVNLRAGAVENERPPIIGLIVINVSEQPRPAARSFIAPRIFMSVGESLVAPIRFGQIHLFTAARGPLHARTHARTLGHDGFAAEGSGAAFIIDERGVGRRVWAVSGGWDRDRRTKVIESDRLRRYSAEGEPGGV